MDKILNDIINNIKEWNTNTYKDFYRFSNKNDDLIIQDDQEIDIINGIMKL